MHLFPVSAKKDAPSSPLSAAENRYATFSSWKNGWSRLTAFLATLSLLLTGGLIFRKFLFGDALLLYRDIGADSFIIYYTDFVCLSNYLRSYGFPSWSFSVGMGQDLVYAAGDLIWQPVSWLPSRLIAPALVFQHLGKVIIAGLLFFRFLQLRRLRPPVPLLGSLLLSFSAYMCIGSCWYSFADEVVCFAAILLGAETALQNGRWLILALAVALVGMITPFHLYLCALFLSSYVPLRLFGQYGWKPRDILRTCLKLAAVAALSFGLGATVTLPYLAAVLNSPRASEAISAVATLSSAPVFGFATPLHYITAALKPFANDMLGTGANFQGWQNYLEAPLTYCGLLCLLLFPQALTGGTRRQKAICILFFIGLILPTVFPWFRHLFWLFQGDYYRTYSLFWVLGVLTLSLTALSRYLVGHGFSLKLLTLTTVVLVGILNLPVGQWQALINSSLRFSATLLLLLYGLLLAAGWLMKKQTLAVWLILGLSTIELVQIDQITVSHRNAVRKGELRGVVLGEDEAIKGLRQTLASDQQKFFRTTKLRPSGPEVLFTLNDAMLYGYYGTSS